MRRDKSGARKTIALIRHASGPDMSDFSAELDARQFTSVDSRTHMIAYIASPVTVNCIRVAIDRPIDRAAEPQRSRAHTAISSALKEGNNRGHRANVYTLLRKAGNQSGWKIRYYGAIADE